MLLKQNDSLRFQGIDSFATLNQVEQSALLEREVFDLQQSNDSTLVEFSKALDGSMDKSLIELLNTTNSTEIPKNGSASHLTEICVDTVETLLQRFPPEMATAAKLFLNRPLPVYLRKRIWAMNLLVDFVELDQMPSRLAPSTDVLISRRILILLEKHLPSFSSTTNAAVIKRIVSNFMRSNTLPLPDSEENFGIVDTLFFVLIPLALTFNNCNHEDNYIHGIIEIEYHGRLDNDAISNRLVERALNAVVSNRQLGLLNESGGFVLKSPYLVFTNALLELKNRDLSRKLSSLYGGPGNNYSTAVFGNLSGDTKFEDAIDSCLLKGLSGLLPVDTVLYVWDQGLIGKFDTMLPAVCSALLLGIGDEMMSVTQFSVALDIFQSYCSSVSVDMLQKLMTKYCASEMNEIFEVQGSLVFGVDENGILHAIYPKLFPDSLYDARIYRSDSSKSFVSNSFESQDSMTDVEERVRRETGLALRSI